MPFDSNAENKTIPVRYNSFLNSRVYVTTTCYAIGNAARLPSVTTLINAKRRIPLRWLFYKKVSHKGRLTIKILGIPVWRRKTYSIEAWHNGKNI